jgi:hypothetical protein
MNALLDRIAADISNQGLSIALLGAAVWFLYGKIKECEADRNALWERIFKIQQNHENP